jgi:hypothetical protein
LKLQVRLVLAELSVRSESERSPFSGVEAVATASALAASLQYEPPTTAARLIVVVLINHMIRVLLDCKLYSGYPNCVVDHEFVNSAVQRLIEAREEYVGDEFYVASSY